MTTIRCLWRFWPFWSLTTFKRCHQHRNSVTNIHKSSPVAKILVQALQSRMVIEGCIVEQKWINNLALSAPKMHSTWTQHKLNISKLRLKMTQRELKMNTKCTFEAKLTRKKLWCQCDSLWHRDYVHVSQIMIMWLIIPLICSWVHDRRSVISNSKII